MSARKDRFDFVQAIKDAGFELVRTGGHGPGCEHGYSMEQYRRHFEHESSNPLQGSWTATFDVDVYVVDSVGHRGIGVEYSNGKVRQHMPDKRAFNAIRDTVRNNGFEF